MKKSCLSILIVGSILTPFSRIPSSSADKLVIFDFFGSTDEYVRSLLAKYTKIRNYFNAVPPGAAYYALGHITAQAANATLIAYGHPDYAEGRHPRILPGVLHFDQKNRTIDYIWRRYYPPRSPWLRETPSFVRVDSMDLNFAICEMPKQKSDSGWDLTVFADSFDRLTWLCLLTAWIFVSVLAFTRVQTGINLVFFSSLSVLLSEEVSGIPRKMGRSKLFVLWMFVCLIVVPFYSGDIASQVISPSPDERLEKLEDFLNQNYTVISGDQITLNFFNDVVTSLSEREYVQPDIRTLEQLLKQIAVRPYYDDSFYKSLVQENKVISIMGWPFVISATNNAFTWMNNNPGVPRQKCYVGKKLVRYGDSFHIFLPPRALETAHAYQLLFSAGIAQRWNYEYLAPFHSSRVQNRVRFKSPIFVVDEQEKRTVVLAMKGKTVTIFILWALCLFGCGLTFCWELRPKPIQAKILSK